MRLLFLILQASLLCNVAECWRHYLLTGQLPKSNNGQQLHHKEIRRIVEEEISSVLPNHSPTISRIIEKQERHKSSSKHIEVELSLDSEITDAIFNTRNVRILSYIKVEKFEALDDAPEPDCFNEGYLGPNGTCICQNYYNGDRCQFLGCANGGVADTYVKVPQCFCPPGYNDYFCENRGCRPPVQDDINPPSKNLIVLMPATTVFLPLRNQILDHFAFVVNTLQRRDPNWIGLFVGGNYYTADHGFEDDKVFMKLIITSNLTEFISRMRTMDGLTIAPYLEDRDQGLVGALDVVLSDSLNGHISGYPMILAYSNTVDSVDWSLFGEDQQAIFWRAKIFMNVINNSSAPMDITSDEFQDYYDYSKSTHSPLFFYNIEDIDDMHYIVLPELFKPQYLDVRSQADCASGLVQVMRDYGDSRQDLNVFVTLNQPLTDAQLTLSSPKGSSSVNATYSNSHLQVHFELPTNWTGFSFKGGANMACSIYTWVSSDETVLWAGHDDSNTDVGYVQNNAEAGYHFALTPVAVNQTVTRVNYQSFDSKNAATISSVTGFKYKPSCTLMYEFDKIPHCIPGIFVHQVTLVTSRGLLTRVFPGLCASTYIPSQPDQPPTTMSAPTTTNSGINPPTCTVEGTAAFADDRNHPFRDFIFAVEWSDSDYRFINAVEYVIPGLLDAVYDVYFQQRFTFIIFNNNYAKTLVSHTRRDIFENRVHTIIENELGQIFSGWWNNTETTADSIDSVIMANLETLNPKAQVFVFTANPGTSAQPNLNKVLPKSIQVNYFYDFQVFDAYPFSVITRQTNGRWFSTAAPDLFVRSYIATTSELIYDTVYQNDAGSVVIHTFRVEEQATTLEILINGAVQNFTLTAASIAPLNSTSFMSGTVAMSLTDISTRGDDLYTLQVYCTYCMIQIRLASPVQVILGFTGYPNDDTRIQNDPSAWLRMDTTQPYRSYVTARLTGLSPNETVTRFTIRAHMGSFLGTSFTANTQGNLNQMVANMQLRNSSYCSYQWIGEIDSNYEYDNWAPELDGIQFIITVQTDKGNEFTRIVYYYQPNELLANTICQNGGTLDGYGDCLCSMNFTGDYCEVPVCQNGGRQNFGACNCLTQYMGQFCEQMITVKFVPVTATTTKVLTTTTKTVTTTSATLNTTTSISTPTPVRNTTVMATLPPTSGIPMVTTSQAAASTSAIKTQNTVTTPTTPSTIGSSTAQTVKSTVTVTTSVPTATTQKNASNYKSLCFTVFVSAMLSLL